MASETPDFDTRLAAELSADFEGLKEQLRLAMTTTVKARNTDGCDKCDCKHFRYVEVPDYKQKLAIAEWWANRGFGRPGQQASEESGERIVFQRLVEMPPEDEAA